MGFCSKCGRPLEQNADFCTYCGTHAEQTVPNQNTYYENTASSALVFKYERSALFFILTEPLDVTLDGQLNFRLINGREVCYNVPIGNHTLTAYVPYLAGSRYGDVTKKFYVGPNETLQITYKPPAAMFMQGNIIIKKV